jgi:hypothetical protein
MEQTDCHPGNATAGTGKPGDFVKQTGDCKAGELVEDIIEKSHTAPEQAKPDLSPIL